MSDEYGLRDASLRSRMESVQRELERSDRLREASQPPDRIMVRVDVFRSAGGDRFPDDGPLTDLFKWLGGIVTSVPAEHRDALQFDIGTDLEEFPSVVIDVWYSRPETDEELVERLERRRRALAQKEAAERERELAALARLKAKYEGS